MMTLGFFLFVCLFLNRHSERIEMALIYSQDVNTMMGHSWRYLFAGLLGRFCFIRFSYDNDIVLSNIWVIAWNAT